MRRRTDLVGNVLVLAERESASAREPTVIDRTFALAKVVERGPLGLCHPADRPAGRYGSAALESSHPPIVHPIASTMATPHADAAERLLARLRSAEVRALVDHHGDK
jgi:ABC-type molybdate transport system substrate-binding protein